MIIHGKKSLANEYCLCRGIPHRWKGNEQLVIGNKEVGYDVIFSIYNIPYSEIVSTIDSMCVYNEQFDYFIGLKKNFNFIKSF